MAKHTRVHTSRSAFIPSRPPRRGVYRLAALFVALYAFLFSVSLVEAGFGAFGAGLSTTLIAATDNPFIGLMTGLVATSIVQSSSCTTSIIVGMVASGALTVGNAIPLVMGANIGTTVTNTLVSLGCVSRKDEFRRAFAAATVHDFFNLLTAAILLPLELATGYLQTLATFLTKHLAAPPPGTTTPGPLKPLFSPLLNLLKLAVEPLPYVAGGVLILVIAGGLLFGSLLVLMGLLKGFMAGKVRAALHKTVASAPLLGLLAGLVLTAVIQSSSIVTSMLVPLAAAGILQLEQAFAITLGANIGTTATALVASLAAGPQGLTIAVAHLFFNVTGVAIFFPLPPARRIPMRLARGLAAIAAKSPAYAILYVITVFYMIPGLLILIWQLLH